LGRELLITALQVVHLLREAIRAGVSFLQISLQAVGRHVPPEEPAQYTDEDGANHEGDARALLV
jgi:hypothetical protein